MKVALCISGQPRFYKGPGFDSIKSVFLDRYNPDVFFHTWWSQDDVGKTYAAAPWSGVAGSPDLIVRAETLEELLALYRPKLWKNEPIRVFSLARDYSGNTSDPSYAPANLFSSSYSLKQAGSLKRIYEATQGLTYDRVIRIRFDSWFRSEVHLEKSEADAVLIPDVCPNPDLLYDCVSFSNSADFDAMSNLYDKLDEYFLDGVSMNAEQMFMRNLLQTGLLPRVRKVPMKYEQRRVW